MEVSEHRNIPPKFLPLRLSPNLDFDSIYERENLLSDSMVANTPFDSGELRQRASSFAFLRTFSGGSLAIRIVFTGDLSLSEVPGHETEMWISRQIIEAMGGTISEISLSDGKKEWRVVIPMIKSTVQAVDENPRKSSTYFSKERILYIEDNEAIRKTVKNLLKCTGLKVCACKNGREGFKAYKGYCENKGRQCIITDLRMPVMSGWEFIRAVRNYEKSQGRKFVPIIVLTGVSSESELCNSFKEAKNVKVLHKPIPFSNLLETIQIAINREESFKELPQPVDKQILVIEDDKVASKITAQFLKRFGYTTATQSNIKEAVEYYKANYRKTAMIIQDGMLLDGKGMECIKQIREFEAKAGISPPVIVVSVSGTSIEYQKEEYKGLGVADFLVKPITVHDLENVVSRFLS